MGHRPAAWVIDQAKRVLRYRWDTNVDQIRNAEVGVLRALAQSFGKGKLPDLPTFDQAVRQSLPLAQRLPEWHHKFEEANKNRRIR